MTLAKTCHTSNMMQDLVEATHCLNRDVSIVSLLNWKKIESHFETWSSDAQQINLTFVAYSFVANFVRYISAKYYLNWLSFHTVIMKVLGVNFFLKHSVVIIVILYDFSSCFCCRLLFRNIKPVVRPRASYTRCVGCLWGKYIMFLHMISQWFIRKTCPIVCYKLSQAIRGDQTSWACRLHSAQY